MLPQRCSLRQGFLSRALKRWRIKRESRTYKSWQEMWRRCTKPTHISYKNYGAKGVRVAQEWDSFKVFLADMGERPPGFSLDRKDNSLGYCKDNCRWATRLEQNQNRSQCHFITIEDVYKRQGQYTERTPTSLSRWCGKPYPNPIPRTFQCLSSVPSLSAQILGSSMRRERSRMPTL